MTKNKSLIDVFAIVIRYALAMTIAFYAGYEFGIKKVMERIDEASYEIQEVHRDSLRADVELLQFASDSTKQRIALEELRWLRRYLDAKLK